MWNEFYSQRINSTYQDYFEKKYAPFLKMIVDEYDKSKSEFIKYSGVLDEGCGIGSIGKYLTKTGVNIPYMGYDIDWDMINLSMQNVKGRSFYQDNILNPSVIIHYNYIRVTHGVLEHFTDEEIHKIFTRYSEGGLTSIHYVPLDKYKVPSFGDERLLIPEKWLLLAKPFGDLEATIFNDGFDLCFKIKPFKNK